MTPHDVQEAPAQRGKDPLLDRRLMVLETRFDTTLTMLPSEADLAELKAELKAAITMVLGFGGTIFTMLSRLPHA